MRNAPHLTDGALAVDDRGTLAFVNDFDFEVVKRFYVVRNHQRGFVRAWHGHQYETKYVTAVSGTAVVCCVEIDDWKQPSADASVQRFVLSSTKPTVLEIPAGYANGFMSLTDDTGLLFFSTSTVEESAADDYRYPARYWDPWTVEER